MEGRRMRNISDIIEQYLKNILHESPEQMIEIQRNELADRFQCVPSQINYVISTRFTLEKGYIVESKRGGGGYIRIQRIKLPTNGQIHEHVIQTIGNNIDQASGEGLIVQLKEADLITDREARILQAAISREVLAFKLPLRDEIRAVILKAMLISLLCE
jgi:transcriptional regulator CtsR